LLFFCTSRNPKSNSWLTCKLLIYILLFDFSFFAQAAIGSKATIGLPKHFFCVHLLFLSLTGSEHLTKTILIKRHCSKLCTHVIYPG
jgi:hypothetical protein